MVEFQPFGPKLPHDPEGLLEHERDVREEAERAHDVKRASETAHRSSLGYAIVLLVAALFVASCFLPYVGYAGLSIPGTKTTTSLYQQLTLGPNGGSSDLSSLLYLFGGLAPVAAVAVVALVRGERRPVLPALLVGAVVAWSLTWIGALLRLGTFLGASLEIGFWLQAVSIGVAVIGTILVATRRTGAHERGAAGLGA
jgi:hypothetical protein